MKEVKIRICGKLKATSLRKSPEKKPLEEENFSQRAIVNNEA